MKHVVGAVFADPEQAADAVWSLRQHEFTDQELNVITSLEEAEQAHGMREQYSRLARREEQRTGAWTGVAIGAAVGGYVGLLTMVLLPALPLFVVGFGAVGGFLGGMLGSGMNDELVKHAEDALRAGGVVVLIHEDSEERAQLADRLLQEHHANEVTRAHLSRGMPQRT
jgi:uncharacterized membrane protein